jgi:hypothetical protein
MGTGYISSIVRVALSPGTTYIKDEGTRVICMKIQSQAAKNSKINEVVKQQQHTISTVSGRMQVPVTSAVRKKN